jgi:hypothetical protein
MTHRMRATRRTPSGREPASEGRKITLEELAHWRNTGEWPNGVRQSNDYVELTPEEIRALRETGTWPARLG